MVWEKIGQFAVSDWKKDWFMGYALQPTPIVLDDRIRVYCGFRDQSGISRVGFVDLSLEHPEKVLGVSQLPALDLGKEGRFDDNGVVPSAVLSFDNKIYLFFAGYQIPTKVRFMVLGGLAVSHDGGLSFERVNEVPILERTPNEVLFRVAHSVLIDQGDVHVFYGGGSEFMQGSTKTLPAYDIRYMKSNSLFEFPKSGKTVLECEGDEHRLGRPYVFRGEDGLEMYFGYGTEKEPYWLTSAKSKDYISWVRSGERITPVGPHYNDDQMQAYPSVFKVRSEKYLLYNGNEYGKYGFVICKEKK